LVGDVGDLSRLDMRMVGERRAPGVEHGEKANAGALAPRCVKDVIEERLFDKRRDLFADLSAVFMDTTSLSFYGEGGETLGGMLYVATGAP
jgi:hypothetical protein